LSLEKLNPIAKAHLANDPQQMMTIIPRYYSFMKLLAKKQKLKIGNTTTHT
jgi:hypothetical protein